MAVAVSGGTKDPSHVGGGRASGPADGRSSLLEHSQNVVTLSTSYEIIPCGCECMYCPDCATRKGYNLRAKLIPILETFQGVMMLTLTIDPTLFTDAQAAYMYARKKQAIAVLMRRLYHAGHLHSRRYFCVVEFQKRTEFTHYHVLIDATHVPKDFIDRVWSRLRPKGAGPVAPNRPAFGMTRFSMPRFENPEHAGRYVTKYITKTPEHGFPAWVLDLGAETRVPRYSVSKGFWGAEPKPANPNPTPRESSGRSYRDRIDACGLTSIAFDREESVDTQTGEVFQRRRFRMKLDLTADQLASLMPPEHRGRARLSLPRHSGSSLLDEVSKAVGRRVSASNGLIGRAGSSRGVNR